MAGYFECISADHATPEVLEIAESVYDGWFADSAIDWDDFIERMEGMPLADGRALDFGSSMLSPAIVKIRKHIRAYSKL